MPSEPADKASEANSLACDCSVGKNASSVRAGPLFLQPQKRRVAPDGCLVKLRKVIQRGLTPVSLTRGCKRKGLRRRIKTCSRAQAPYCKQLSFVNQALKNRVPQRAREAKSDAASAVHNDKNTDLYRRFTWGINGNRPSENKVRTAKKGGNDRETLVKT